jgi:hypothetical protein
LAHCLFNVPVAVWILEGFVAGVPREIDEMAAIDGYSFPAVLHPHIPAADRQWHRRHRVLLLHVLVGRAIAGDDIDGDRRAAVRGGDDAQPTRCPEWTGRCSRRPAC